MKFNRKKLDKIFMTTAPEDAETEEGKQPVAILVQHSPDPDCLGAAMGMSLLLSEVYGLQSDIFHKGEISHPQNKAMKGLLHIEIKDEAEFNPDDYMATVVLDTDLTNTGFKSEKLLSADVRIDHHDMDREDNPKYKDVRAVGATCSIIWEYLKECSIDLSQHPRVATGLILGIKTDTLEFTTSGTSELDMEAFRDLLPHVDKQALASIGRFTMPIQMFDTERVAYENKQIKGTVLTSFIGQIKAHDRDTIAIIADRFSRMEGVNTVVIMAVIDNDLQASIRSNDDKVDVNSTCVKVFGKDFGGARKGESSGGARLPLGKAFELLEIGDTKNKVMEEMVLNISTKVFATLGVQE